MTSERPNLLIVSQHFYPENFRINDLVSGLVEDGFDVDVLCGHPNYPEGIWFEGYDGKNPSYEEHEGVTIFRAREYPRKGNTSKNIFLNYVSWPIAAAHKARRLKKKYDLVICYETSPVLMIYPAYIAARKNKCPLITYVLDIWPDNLYSVVDVKNSIVRKIAQGVSDWLYKKSNVIITMSDEMSTHLKERLKRNIPYYTIPQHAEDYYSERLCDEGLENKYKRSIVFLFAGNLSPAQNLESIIDAIVDVNKDDLGQIIFLIVGSGMSESALKQRVENMGVSDIIHFAGRVAPEEIPKYTNIAHALILPLSSSQNLSLTLPAKLSSYFAAGKPVIASCEGASARVIRESGAGLVSAPNNMEQLKENIIEFIKCDESEKKNMGKNAWNYYENNFKRDTCVKMLENVIEATLISLD